MIQVNLFAEPGPLLLRPTMGASATDRSKILALVLTMLLVVAGGLGYLMFSGIPQTMAQYMPAVLADMLSIPDPTIDPLTTAQPNPVVVPDPQGTSVPKPVVAKANAVEEVVKTVRPDLFYNKERKEYRQLLPMERINLQKAMVRQLFTTFKAITPANFGFTDLAYKVPDYYFARGLGKDEKSIGVFLDSLRRRSLEFNSVPPPEGKHSLEFTSYGRLKAPETTGEKLEIVPAKQVAKEITALGELSARHQVKFPTLEQSSVSDQGLYKRILVRGQTKADYPALLQFSEALQTSGLRVGVIQVTMRPSENEGLITVFDFVVYASPN